MDMRAGVLTALLGLLLAGCSATQVEPVTPFAVRQARAAVVNAEPSQISLQAMQFLSPEVGFMAVTATPWPRPLGSQGVAAPTLLATVNGGGNWLRHLLPQGLSVTDIDFRSSATGFLVGKTKGKAELWATADSGRTWQLRATEPLSVKPYRQSLDTVSVGADGSGYALLDGMLLRTADGGWEWRRGGLPARVNDVVFLSPTAGVAISDRTIWRTSDAGQNWQAVWRLPSSLSIADTYFLSRQQIDVPYGLTDAQPTGVNLLAASGSTVWAVFNEGSGCAMPHCTSDLVLSQDGGRHWRLKTAQSLSSPARASGPVPVVTGLAASPTGAFAVAESGSDIMFVPPAGEAENVLAPAPGVDIAAMTFDGQGGIFVADSGAHLFRRSLRATSFSPVWPPLVPTLGIQFVSRRAGYGLTVLAGRYSLLATHDGGRSWRMAHTFAAGVTPSGFAFTRAGVGYLFATDQSRPNAIPGQVLRTGDAGKTWRTVYGIGDAAAWIARVNLQTFGRNEVLQGLPRVRLSRSGGKDWRTTGGLPFSGPQAMLATWFLSPRVGWALDAPTGALYRTTSGGARWRKVGRLPASTFAAIDFVNGRDGWVVEPQSMGAQLLLRTTDGGTTWREAALPQNTGLAFYGLPDRTLSFISPEVGYLCTNSGVYRTTDGGRIWSLVR